MPSMGDKGSTGRPGNGGSLFGGPLSTRAACINSDALIAKLQQEDAKNQQQKAKLEKQGTRGVSVPRPARPPPPPNPQVVKKQKLKSDLDAFDDLNHEGPAPKPKPKAPTPPPPNRPSKPPSSSQPRQDHRAPPDSKPGLKRPVSTSTAPSSANGNPSRALPPPAPRPSAPQTRPISGSSAGARPNPSSASTRPLSTGTRPAPPGPSRPAGAPPAGKSSSSGQPSTSGKQSHEADRLAMLLKARLPHLSAKLQDVKSIVGSKPSAQQQQQHGGRPQGGGNRPRSEGPGPHAGMKRPLSSTRPPPRRSSYYDDDDEYEDDFVVDDDEGDAYEEVEDDWRKEMRRLTGYDPRRYRDEHFDDRSMEASWRDVEKEERRSAMLGKLDDEREEELERKRQLEKKKRKMGK